MKSLFTFLMLALSVLFITGSQVFAAPVELPKYLTDYLKYNNTDHPPEFEYREIFGLYTDIANYHKWRFLTPSSVQRNPESTCSFPIGEIKPSTYMNQCLGPHFLGDKKYEYIWQWTTTWTNPILKYNRGYGYAKNISSPEISSSLMDFEVVDEYISGSAVRLNTKGYVAGTKNFLVAWVYVQDTSFIATPLEPGYYIKGNMMDMSGGKQGTMLLKIRENTVVATQSAVPANVSKIYFYNNGAQYVYFPSQKETLFLPNTFISTKGVNTETIFSSAVEVADASGLRFPSYTYDAALKGNTYVYGPEKQIQYFLGSTTQKEWEFKDYNPKVQDYTTVIVYNNDAGNTVKGKYKYIYSDTGFLTTTEYYEGNNMKYSNVFIYNIRGTASKQDAYNQDGQKTYTWEYDDTISKIDQDIKGLKLKKSIQYDLDGKVIIESYASNFTDPNNHGTYMTTSDSVINGTKITWGTQYFVNYKEDESKRVLNKTYEEEFAVEKLKVNFGTIDPSYEVMLKKILTKYLNEYRNDIANKTDLPEIQTSYYKYGGLLEQAFIGLEYKLNAIKKDQYKPTVLVWMGTDSKGDFNGFWIFPQQKPLLSPDAIFIDLTDVSSVGSAIGAIPGGIASLSALPKRYDKWDSISSDQSRVFTPSENQLYNSNVFTRKKQGGYLPLTEYLKPDLTTKSLISMFKSDMKAKGIDLASIPEKDVIINFFEYFMAKNYAMYSIDWGDTVQTTGETINRKSGDCDDWAVATTSLLYNLFIDLGNTSAADRIYATGLTLADGAGHAASAYRGTDGVLYLIETGGMFQGFGKNYLAKDKILMPVDSNFAGYNELFKENYTVDYYANKYAITVNPTAAWYLSNQFKREFTPSEKTLVGTNYGALIAKMNTFITPANKIIDTLASALLVNLQRSVAPSNKDWKDLSVIQVIRATHSYVKNASVVEPGAAVWQKPEVTVGAFANKSSKKIVGTEENLAFVEASILQNVLSKFFYVSTKNDLEADLNDSNLHAQNKVHVMGTKDALKVGYITDVNISDAKSLVILDPQSIKIQIQTPSDILGKDIKMSAASGDTFGFSFENWSEYLLK